MAFDALLLQRPGARAEYSAQELTQAEALLAGMSTDEQQQLQRNIIAGLPGSEESFTLQQFQQALDTYAGIDAAKLREHLVLFLREIVPVAEEVSVNLAIHPDDPPYPILGLPRVVSTAADVQALADAVPSIRNGRALAPARSACAPTMTCPPWYSSLPDASTSYTCAAPSATRPATSTRRTTWKATWTCTP